MSIFPTKILLATDGSEEATLAAKTAVDLADKTNSELHVSYVGQEYAYPIYAVPDYESARRIQQNLEQEVRKLLDAEVEQVKAAGGTVVGAHFGVGRPDAEIVKLAEEIGAGLIVMGSRGRGRIRRAYGQRFRLGRSSRSLSGFGGALEAGSLSGQDPLGHGWFGGGGLGGPERSGPGGEDRLGTARDPRGEGAEPRGGWSKDKLRGGRGRSLAGGPSGGAGQGGERGAGGTAGADGGGQGQGDGGALDVGEGRRGDNLPGRGGGVRPSGGGEPRSRRDSASAPRQRL
jgi:nucleotide-binding universal stress UspA family protein